MKRQVKSSAYVDWRVLRIESAGFKAIGGLLDMFVPALVAEQSERTSYDLKLIDLLPFEYVQEPGSKRTKAEAIASLSAYQRILAATDYVSGMTDSFAVKLFQELSGIRLPT